MINQSSSLEDLELDLLLEAVRQHVGFDFRGYERAQLKQRLRGLMQSLSLTTVSALQDRVLHDKPTEQMLLHALGHHDGGLFDQPDHLRALRDLLGTSLRSWPTLKIWIAECPSAQVAWTWAILLEEMALYERSLIFVTNSSVRVEREAWNPASLPCMPRFEANYVRSGGAGPLARYFDLSGGQPNLLPRLRHNIVWGQHSLVTDASFNEFQLIICRDVLSDFGPILRKRALYLFRDSLSFFGLLSVNAHNMLEAKQPASGYRTVSRPLGLYQRLA